LTKFWGVSLQIGTGKEDFAACLRPKHSFPVSEADFLEALSGHTQALQTLLESENYFSSL